jgi:uncharacterized protein YbjT (DUF2867 family)
MVSCRLRNAGWLGSGFQPINSNATPATISAVLLPGDDIIGIMDTGCRSLDTVWQVMKIIVFGPTGGTGRAILSQALGAGHRVTAFSRQPEAVTPARGLDVVSGNPLDGSSVERAMAGHDAVLSALGGRPWRRDRICSRATQNIAAAMPRHGIKRIVAISTFGAGETRAHVGWLARTLLFGVVLRSEVADKEEMERLLAASDLDWTVVRVGRLTDGSARDAWRAADDGSIYAMGSIARADVVAFMVAQIENNQWVRRKPVLVD